MILPNGATVAVIDGGAMRLFRNRGHEPSIDLVELPVEAAGEVNAGSGARHRSSAANPDHGRHEEDDFVTAASRRLNQAALDGRIERLLIIADARTLGEVRRHLHPAAVAKIAGELSRDLVSRSKADIAAAIHAA